MAIVTGSDISVTLVSNLANQVGMSIWTYKIIELVGTPTAVNYAEGWWNHVKDAYRDIVSSSFGAILTSVRVTEMGNPLGEYGEFAIPTSEKTGTRTPPADSEAMPVFISTGVRLSVGTRQTRPGQKRIPYMCQSDANSQVLSADWKGVVATFMDFMVQDMLLGAPAAGVVLLPAVVGLNADGTIREDQPVTGYVIDEIVTSQVSRRQGRGI